MKGTRWRQGEAERQGRIAYNSYGVEFVGHALLLGQRLPNWNELAREIQVAWMAVGTAVRNDTLNSGYTDERLAADIAPWNQPGWEGKPGQ